MKKLFLLSLLSLGFILTACGGNETPVVDTTPPPTENEEPLELTLAELAAFDGREGRRGFIAVDGIIYEVTGSSRWRNGNHNGYQAGQDLTQFIDQVSPHGRSVLSRMPQVGILVEE